MSGQVSSSGALPKRARGVRNNTPVSQVARGLRSFVRHVWKCWRAAVLSVSLSLRIPSDSGSVEDVGHVLLSGSQPGTCDVRWEVRMFIYA